MASIGRRFAPPYRRGPEADFKSREFVFSEDNSLIMMRNKPHKLAYYLGQEEGELSDLREDPDELWNLWEKPEYVPVKQRLLVRMLEWLAASNYYNAGYKRDRSRHYNMRWPSREDPYLHGARSPGRPRQVDVL